MTEVSKAAHEEVLVDGGELEGLLCSCFSTSKTTELQPLLNLPELRSQRFKTALGLMLNTGYPAFLVWGRDRLLFYNNAYSDWLEQSATLVSLGQSLNQTRNPAWRQVRSRVDNIFATGQATKYENEPFGASANPSEGGTLTWSYTPLWNAAGEVEGAFVTGYQMLPPPRNQRVRAQTVGADSAPKTIAATNEIPFHQIGDHLPMMIWLSAPDGAGVWFNQQWYEFTGQTQEEALGDGWLTMLHPDDAVAVHQTCLQAHQNYESVQLEYRLWRHDGKHRWVFDSAVPWFDKNGTYLGYIGSIIDITERKRIEDDRRQVQAERERLFIELAAERAHFEAVLRQMPEGVLIADAATGNLVLANDQTKQILHYTHELNVELKSQERLVPFQAYRTDGRLYAAEEYPLVRSLQQGEVISHEEMELRYDDGKRIIIDVNSSPIFDRQGQITSAVVVFQDITERQQTEAALRTSEISHRTLSEAVPDFVWACDENGHADFVNARWLEYTGLTIEELNRGGLSQVNHPDDFPRLMEEWAIARQRGEAFESEFRYRRKDGEYRWFMGRAVPIKDDNGKIVRWVGTTTDIHALKQAEAALRQSETILKSFIASSPIGMAFFDRDFRYIYANEALAAINGIPLSEHLNRTLREVLPQWAPIVEPIFQQVMDTQIPLLNQEVIGATNPDDFVRYCLVNFFPVCLPDGTVIGLGVTDLDITERRQAEEALRRSEERLRISQELSLDAFTILDCVRDETNAIVDFVWSYVNSKAAELLQHPAAELVGQSLLSVLPSNRFNTDLFDRYVRVVETGESHDIELSYEADGITGWFRNMAVKLEDGVAVFFSDITERKRSEQALLESETIARTRAEELAALMEITPAAIWIARDPQCHRINANQTAHQLMRTQPGTATTATPKDGSCVLPFRQCSNGKELAPQDLPLQKAIRLGQEIVDELEFVFEDGTVRFLYGKAVPLHNADGQVRGAVAAFIDISDRKQIEQALRTSEERLRFALDGADLGTWEYDLVSGQIIWSERTRIMTGVPLDVAVDYELFNNLIHPDDREWVNLAVERAIAEQSLYDVEMRILWADGSTHWVRSIGRAQYADNGTPIRMIGVALDVTERKQTEAALRQSEERLRLAMEGAQMATWDVDLITGTAIWSDYHFTVLGYEPASTGEASVALWYDRIHPDDRDWVTQEWYQAQQEHRLYRAEYRVIRADNGQLAWLEGLGSFTYNSNNEAVRSIGILLDISDRKQVEISLAAQEQRYRYIFQAVNVSIWEEDFSEVKAAIDDLKAEGVKDFRQYFNEHPEFVRGAISQVRLRDINQASLQLFGAQNKAELLNSLEQIFTPETQAAFVEELVAIAAEATNFAAETVMRTLQGESVNVWFSISFPPPSEPYDRVLVSLLDISDRKRTEAALRESEGQLRLAQQAAGAGLWDWDIVNNQVTWSAEYYQLYGLDQSITPSYEHWLASILEVDRARVDQVAREALEHRTNLNVEFRVQHPLRGLCWLTAIGQTFYNAEGQPIRMTGIALNISDRKQAEAALRESEERLRLALVAAHQGLYDLNVQTGEAIVSPEYAQMLGYEPSEFKETNAKWRDRLHPDDVAVTYQAYADYVSGKLDTYRVEFRQRTKQGTWKWILALGKIVAWDSDGNPLRLVGTHTDIADLKQAQQEREELLAREQAAREQAENANRIKDEFLAVLSHELRSPLNPILGWSRLLQTGKLNPTKTQQALETIERNARLQSDLIEDLLDVSRILQGKLSLAVSPVHLASTVQAAIETVRLAAEAKSIQIEMILESGIGRVLGDSTRLQQVVWNLLSNGVKFTPAGGRVEVRLEQVKRQMEAPTSSNMKAPKDSLFSLQTDTSSQPCCYAQITVSDTGKGIAPDFLPYVFDYFRQEDGATTRKFGGLGLGLAIVRHLVELHGGTIRVESPGENMGASFIVQLPLLKQEESGMRESVGDAPLALSAVQPLANLNILVVDDDDDTRDLIVFLLEQSGASVASASSAGKGLEALLQARFDILISDIGMPEMDGYMLMRQIRSLSAEQGGQIPAIALTAYAGEIDYQQAIAAGFQRHIPKPVKPDELIKAILQLLNQNTYQSSNS